MTDTEDKPEPPEEIDLTQYGYAPGGYNPLCDDCENRFIGDKRSWRCKPCAEKAKEKYDNRPEQNGPPEAIYMWFADNGNVRKWSFEEFAEAEVKYIRADTAESISLYLTKVYGEKCNDYDPDCRTCQAWASYDDYKSEKARTELTRQAQDMGMYDDGVRFQPREPELTPDQKEKLGIKGLSKKISDDFENATREAQEAAKAFRKYEQEGGVNLEEVKQKLSLEELKKETSQEP